MKINKIALSLLGVAALMLGSCSEGKYWNEPSNRGEVYAFPKPSENVRIPAEDEVPDYYEVKITRSIPGDAVTIPVTFTGDKEGVLSGGSDVTFEKGAYTANYRINIDKSLMEDGFDYTASLSVEQPEDVMTQVNANNLKMQFTIRHILNLIWEPAGTAMAYSAGWLEMSASDAVEVQVEKATNYPNARYDMYRLVSPYWHMDPEYAQEGYDIQFICYKGSSYRGYGLPEEDQNTGMIDALEDGTPVNIFILAEGAKCRNTGTSYTISGTVGYRATSAGEADAIEKTEATESLRFTWKHN